MASASCLETAIVIHSRRDPALSRTLDEYLDVWQVEIVEFTRQHANLARQAYRDDGKGSGHPARLNFGDCINYAVAAADRDSLLFTGDDFSHTDVRRAI